MSGTEELLKPIAPGKAPEIQEPWGFDSAIPTRRLAQVLGVGMVVALGVALRWSYAQPDIPILAPVLSLVLALGCNGVAYLYQRRHQRQMAAYWLMGAVLLAYGGCLLSFEGVAFEVALAGALVLMLTGVILLPQQWATWGMLILGFEVYAVASGWLPWRRYAAADTQMAHFVLGMSALMLTAMVWRVVSLGKHVSLLEQTVTELQTTDQGLRRQVDELSLLHAIAVAGVEAATEDELLRRATQLVGDILRPDAFGILLLDSATGMLHVRYSFGRRPDSVVIPPIPLNHGIVGRAAADGQLWRVDDVSLNPDYLPIIPQTRSELVVPLKAGNEIVGVLNFESYRPHAFPETGEQLIVTFAGQLSNALYRLRSLRAEGYHAQQLAALYDVARRVATILALDELLAEIVRLIAETLDLYNVEIALIKEGALLFKAGYGGYTDQQFNPDRPLALGQGITGVVAATGKTLLAPDVTQCGDYIAMPTLPDVRAELAVPLLVQGAVIGVLDVKSDSRPLDQEDAAVLEILAGQVAVAIQNAQFVEELRRQTETLGSLYETALATSSVLEPQMLLQRLYEQVQCLLHPDLFVAALYQSGSQTFTIPLAMQGSHPLPHDPAMPLRLEEGGLIGWVLQSGEGLYVADLERESPPVEVYYAGETRSWLGAPMLVRDQLIGALAVQSFRPNAFSLHDRRFFESLVSQVAIALENARLYRAAVEMSQRFSLLPLAGQSIVSSSMDQERMYVAIHEACARLIPCDGFVLALRNDVMQQIDVVYLVDSDGARQSYTLALDQGLCGHVLATERSWLIPDIAYFREAEVVDLDPQHPVHSVLAAPLRIGGKVSGVLLVQTYDPTRTYTLEDQSVLEMLGIHAAVAIENAHLFRAERERTAELEGLRQASLHVTSSLELAPVLQTIVEHALALVHGDNSHIFLYDGHRLRFGAARWGGEVRFLPQTEPREDGVTYRVARSGAPLVIADASQHPLYAGVPWGGAVAALPLRIGKQITGVINVTFDMPHIFNENELRVLGLLADQAAVAVRNAELFEAANRQLKELTILHLVATVGAEATQEDVLIERVTELIGRTLYPDNFGIMLLDEDADVLRFHKSYRCLPESAKARVIAVGQGVSGNVVLDGQPWLISDTHEVPDYISLGLNMRSELCVPLKAGDHIIGVVNAESTREYAFSANDERLLTTLAGQLATAIERVRLFAQTAEALSREHQLNEVARTISAALDLNVILNTVVRLAAELVGGEAGALALLNAEGDAFVEHHSFNLPSTLEALITPTRYAERSLSWRIIEEHGSQLQPDYAAQPEALEELVAAGVCSFMGAPVLVGGAPIGVLVMFSFTPAIRFTRRDLALLESVGLQAGIAIQNARFFADAEARAEELAQALKRSQELDKLKGQFIQNVSHELRTPLAITRGYAELLENGTLGELLPQQKQPIEIIHRRVKMLVTMVEDLTAILEAESQRLRKEPTDLVALIQNAMVDFNVHATNGGINLSAEIGPESVKVLGDPVHLRRVLDNLLGNAFKFTPAGGSITVRLQLRSDVLLLDVADTGIGIPADKLARIFDRFYQVDGSAKRRYSGTGLGLALVREIVEAHGGQVMVESVVDQGSTFHVILPYIEGG